MTQLTDGTEVTIRDIRASDKVMLAAAYERLSDRSRLRRFLAAKPRLTSSDLRYLTEVDGINHYAVVAMLGDPEHCVIAGVARWVRLVEDPASAEAAVVVCDSLQGRGLGRLLALNLADAARERGIHRIRASILSDNPPAMALMKVIGERLTADRLDHGVRELVAELAA